MRDTRLTKPDFRVKCLAQAEVAELADALRSGRSGLTPVRVQIPPSAYDLSLFDGMLVASTKRDLIHLLHQTCA